jgi:hypothetical protein
MPPITVPSSAYRLATGRTEGIPEHAIEISGPLIEIGKTNINGWGITAAAVDGIINQGVGIPIRVCNNIDPHACDLEFDNYSKVGYVTKLWRENGWIHANAAITKPDAAESIANGTWTPFNVGSWSSVGLFNDAEITIGEDGLVSTMDPLAIALFTPPDIPAYQGSKFEMVAAAVTAAKEKQDTIISTSQTKLRKSPDDATKTAAAPTESKVTMTEPEINIEASGTHVPADAPPVEATPPEVTPPQVDSPAEDAPDATTYTQEDLDIAVKTALEAQKTDHDAEIAKTTPNADLQAMFASVKTETIDEINRTALVGDYVDMVTASTILSAPYLVDGKIDAKKMTAKRTDMMAMATATVKQTIVDTKMMVAAMPAGKTAFDEAVVASKTITDESAAAITELREATGRA